MQPSDRVFEAESRRAGRQLSRLFASVRDPLHKGKWNRFDWYGFREIIEKRDAKGFLELQPIEKDISVSRGPSAQ